MPVEATNILWVTIRQVIHSNLGMKWCCGKNNDLLRADRDHRALIVSGREDIAQKSQKQLRRQQ